MAHQTFKVCILNDENVENFYIKHYIDDINPIFNRFKNQVFNRNPSINTPTLKIYWIDSEEDKILVSCEEDFRLYIEHGIGRKIFFCSKTDTSNIQQQQQQQNEQDPSIEMVAMEPEDPDEHKCDRKCRKGHKEEEKKRRHVKKLSEKLKHYEEQSRRASEKRECKNAERLERAKRRVEQIRSIIGSIDPANLDSSFEAATSSSSATQLPSGSATKAPSNPNETPVDLLLSPETTRLLSNAIAGCLQPCTVINKVLNEVFAMIPQMIPLPDEQGDGAGGATVSTANSEQQTIEVPKQTTATNTSDASTPVPVRQANDEIEALFKEAAKELEKMNEIVKSNGGGNKMESSTSTSSSLTGVTQIERIYPNISESVISDSTTVINCESPGEEEEEEEEEEYKQRGQDQQLDMTDSTVMVATPSKMERSRESSIEVHDVGSMMSDDSRDWTILSIDQEEVVESPPALATPPTRIANPKMGAIPKETKSVDTSSQVDPDEIPVSETKRDSIKSVTAETQTAISILSEQQQQQLQASVQRSIDIVRKSIQSIHKSAETVAAHNEEGEADASTALNVPPVSPSYGFRNNVYPGLKPSASVMAAPIVPETPEQSKANIKAKFAPAVIVYDPNPKINAAVHTMMQMGFTNEDNWLTQLLLNLDGDIPKAIQFLTPQSKKKEN